MLINRFISSFILSLFFYISSGQPLTDEPRYVNVYALKAHYGTIVIHTPSVKNISGSRPSGVEIENSRVDIDSVSFNKCNCFPRYGIAISYFDLDNRIIGNGAALSYFIEPIYRISKSLKFNIRAAAGLIYASNPFDSIKNSDNKSYTTHLNPYLQVGVGFTHNLNDHFSLQLMTNFQHFSNGGIKEPNRGVNWLTGSAGILYYPMGCALPKIRRTPFTGWRSTRTFLEAGVLVVPKQGYNSKIMATRKFLVGAFGQATKQYGKVSAVTAGAEIYYDKIQSVSNTTIKRKALQAGIHAGHVFLFNRVSFSQQLGLQIIKDTPDAEDLYFRYGLSYKVSQHIILGINLKAHYDNAEFADVRLSYRF